MTELEKKDEQIRKLTVIIRRLRRLIAAGPDTILDEVTANRMYELKMKKPDYLYSYMGYYIFATWKRVNNLTVAHARMLIIMSYYQNMQARDMKLWYFHYKMFYKIRKDLVDYGYVTLVKIPGKRKGSFVNACTLTPKGRDFEKDYEKFYDTIYTELINKEKTKQYKFDMKEYFRMYNIPGDIRRAAQGGGTLPSRVPYRLCHAPKDRAFWLLEVEEIAEGAEEKNGKTKIRRRRK